MSVHTWRLVRELLKGNALIATDDYGYTFKNGALAGVPISVETADKLWKLGYIKPCIKNPLNVEWVHKGKKC